MATRCNGHPAVFSFVLFVSFVVNGALFHHEGQYFADCAD